jgi:D-alanyl-D-alanine dipeptidase
MWELIRDERYVSDPTKSKGKHTRGTAVDVTLVDHRGNELTMPTSYDDFLRGRIVSPPNGPQKSGQIVSNWRPS